MDFVRRRLPLLMAVFVLVGCGSTAVAFAECFEEPTCGEWEWAEENCEYWESPEATEEELEEGFEPYESELPSKEETEEAGVIDPILFVHGFRGDGSTWHTMIQRFEAAGWPPGWLLNWSYEWWQPSITTAAQIQGLVNAMLTATGRSKVDIVTHSLGALSSRYYIKNLGGAAKVDDWVSLAGPNHGSNLAYGCTYASCIESRPGSTFLTALNATTETPAGPNYHTWRSPWCDWVIVPSSSVVMGGTAGNTATGCISHGGLHEDLGVFEEVRAFVE